MKERLAQLKLRSTDLDREIDAQQASLRTGNPTITPERIRQLALDMRERLRTGPVELRQAYLRLVLKSVLVGADFVTLTGSNGILERLAINGASASVPEVLSFALDWRPQGDSNPCYRRERAVS